VSILAAGSLALLALLPLVAAMHLWRARHRRYAVSSTLLWTRVLAESRRPQPRRLPRRYALLLLQLAVVLAGVLALARPALNAAGGRHILLIVDTSFLMTGRDVAPSRLDAARARALRVVDALGRGDEATIVDAGAGGRVAASSSDPMVLRRALDELSASVGPSTLNTEIPLLTGLRAEAGTNAVVDLYAPLGTPAAVLGSLHRALPGSHLNMVGTTTDDRGVAGLTVSCATPLRGVPFCEVEARLVNTGAMAVTTTVAAAAGGAQQRQSVTLAPGSVAPVRFTVPAAARVVSLHIDGHDAWPGDDAAWAIVPTTMPRRAVLLVSDDPASPLAKALQALPGVALTTAPTTVSTLDALAKRAALTVLDGPSPDILPPGALLVVDPQGVNDALGLDGSVVPASLTRTDRDSPYLRGVDLSSLVLTTAARVVKPSWARTDVEGAAGPLLYHGLLGARRVAVITIDPRTSGAFVPASPSTGNASNLSSLLAFPALLDNAVNALTLTPPTTVRAGMPALDTGTGPDQMTLRLLSGGPARALPRAGGDIILPALAPGAYGMAGPGGKTTLLAASVAVPSDRALPAVGGGAAPAVSVTATPSTALPSDLWIIPAVALLLLLLGEWLYDARRT